MAATATPIEKLLPSQPDVTALNAFTGCTVTVTKHPQPRNSPGEMVVTTQQMSKQQILDLQMSLPLLHGPGYYKFSVDDTGGSGSVKWMMKAGADLPEVPYMSTVPTQSAGSAPPTGDDVTNLGQGYFYNSTLQTLTTPWRQIYNWTPGQPFPTPPNPANATQAATMLPAASTPWTPPGMPYLPPPGYGYQQPADDNRVREVEARLAASERQRESEQRAREAAEQREELRRIREESDRRADEANKRIEALIAKMSEKPSGPDPAVAQLQAELAETRRRQEERERTDQIRAEMRTMQENTDRVLRELAGNKQDPMMQMLTQIMTTSQSASAQSVEAIRESVALSTASSERQTQSLLQQIAQQIATTSMSPAALITLLQSAKGEGAEFSRTMIQSMKELMGTQKEVFGQLLDVASQSGQPAWVGLAQQAMEKIGTIGAAVAESRAQQASQPVPVQRVAQPQQQMRAPAQQPRVAAVPAAPVGPESPEQTRARLAAGVQHLQPGPQTSMHATPLNGAAGSSTAAAPLVEVVDPAVIPPGNRAPRSARTASPRRRRKVNAGDAPLTGEQLRDMDSVQLAESLGTRSDEWLFTTLIVAVKQLRDNIKVLQPDQMAAYVLQGRDEVARTNQLAIDAGNTPDPIPPALELLFAEQYAVLVDRLLPDAAPDYRAAVVEQLGTLIAAETGVTSEDDDEEEDDEGADPEVTG